MIYIYIYIIGSHLEPQGKAGYKLLNTKHLFSPEHMTWILSQDTECSTFLYVPTAISQSRKTHSEGDIADAGVEE